MSDELTREQVETQIDFCSVGSWQCRKEAENILLAHDAAQRERIAQLKRQLAEAQAEVVRLKGQIVVDEESHY